MQQRKVTSTPNQFCQKRRAPNCSICIRLLGFQRCFHVCMGYCLIQVWSTLLQLRNVMTEPHQLRGSSKRRAPRFGSCPARPHTWKIDPERKHCQRRLAPTSSLAPASSTLATMRRPNYKQVRKPTRRTLVGANDTHTFSLPVRNRGSIKAAVKPGHKRKRKNTFIMAWKV